MEIRISDDVIEQATECGCLSGGLEGQREAMSILFEPVKIKNIELRNRFVRSATYDGCAERTGYVSEKQTRLFEELADGGVGLIVTGIAHVHCSGQISPVQNSIVADDCIPGFKRLTASVHDRGAAIAVQLFHAGREAAGFLAAKNEQAIAPSFVPDDPYFTREYRPATEGEIWDIIRAFGDAAGRAREAGFDAVQLHGAHAYLPSQFLSPKTNRRDDDWGGALENRLRFHHEVYRAIRAKVGEDYPVLVKLGVEDAFPGGLEFSEGRVAAQLLAQWGFDALEISQGLRGEHYEGTEYRTRIDRVDREAYFRDWCKRIKRQVNVPTMMVGGLRTFELMEEVVQDGEADFISLCRPLIREPGIVNRWKSGERHRATCISCNLCFEALVKGETLHCAQRKSRGSS
jgi:2,4-dienoyl-CoA reductase-like NADH-dependent reductase (Old Yellow Enzyme family)